MNYKKLKNEIKNKIQKTGKKIGKKRLMIILSIILSIILISDVLLISQNQTSKSIERTLPSPVKISPAILNFTTPVTTWYNNTEYNYYATFNSSHDYILKTNSSLVMTYNMTDYAKDTDDVAITGKMLTGIYYVNLSVVSNFSADKKLIGYDNFTVNVLNKPFICSEPMYTYIKGSEYKYTYKSTQNGEYNMFKLPSWASVNSTTHTIYGYPKSGNYSISITVYNSNGSYTQSYVLSPMNSIVSDNVMVGNNSVNLIYNNSAGNIGIVDNSIYLNNYPVLNVTGNKIHAVYNISVVSGNRYTVSTNSIDNPPVNIIFGNQTTHFSGNNEYNVYMYNNGSKTLFEHVHSYNGKIYVTYNPAKDPLDPVFCVTPAVASEHITSPKPVHVFSIIYVNNIFLENVEKLMLAFAVITAIALAYVVFYMKPEKLKKNNHKK